MEAPWSRIWPEWRWIGKLGSGSHGTVVEAENTAGEKAAIKTIHIPADPAETDSLRAEGMSEAQIRTYYTEKANELLSEVRLVMEMGPHPNIVRTEDYALEPAPEGPGAVIYIRMERLTPLEVYLADHSLTPEEIRKLGEDICQALVACHEHHVLHRDIKPENIFVDEEGHYKLGDFGTARRWENNGTYLTQVGTPLYNAPEVTLGRNYDERADIYSLGLVLYRFLNRNRLPFLNEGRYTSPSERRRAMEWRLKGEPLPLPADAPEPLGRIILKACAYRPQDRYADAVAFGRALEGDRKQVNPRLKGILAGLAAVLAVLGIAAIAMRMGRSILPSGKTETEESLLTPGTEGSFLALAADLTSFASPSEDTSPALELSTLSEEAGSSGFLAADDTSALPSDPAALPPDETEENDRYYAFSIDSDKKACQLADLWNTVFTGDLYLPASYRGLPVRGIQANALEYLSIYEGDLILPPTITQLDAYTVSDCTVEGSVVIPGSVSRIGTKAFCRSSFETVRIEEGCAQIDDRAFEEMTASRLIIPASVSVMSGALEKSTRVEVLEIHSQEALDRWLAGEEYFFRSVGEIVLGEEITDYYVESGCLIHRPSGTLVWTCRDFTIPDNGSVKHIAPYAIMLSLQEDGTTPRLKIPEGVLTIDACAVLFPVRQSMVLNRTTPPFVLLPSSLERIDPKAILDGYVLSYPGTREAWIRLADESAKGNKEWLFSDSAIWVYCTDGKLRSETEEGKCAWLPLYEP